MNRSIEDQERDLRRIAEIDARFGAAEFWGSWMVAAANERETLVDRLRAEGHNIAHEWLARTGSGTRVS